MTAAGSFALTAAVRVIDRVHRDAAVVRHACPSSACGRLCRATDVFVLDVADLADRRHALDVERGGFRPKAASAARTRASRETSCACAPAERAICAPLPGFSSMLWTMVPGGMFLSGSALPTRMSASGPDVTVRPTSRPTGARM